MTHVPWQKPHSTCFSPAHAPQTFAGGWSCTTRGPLGKIRARKDKWARSILAHRLALGAWHTPHGTRQCKVRRSYPGNAMTNRLRCMCLSLRLRLLHGTILAFYTKPDARSSTVQLARPCCRQVAGDGPSCASSSPFLKMHVVLQCEPHAAACSKPQALPAVQRRPRACHRHPCSG